MRSVTLFIALCSTSTALYETNTMQDFENQEVLRIDSEEVAISAIERALARAFEGEAIKLDFDNWPVLRLKYSGERFSGTLTPDIAQAIIDIQEVLNRAYALAVKHTSSLRSLTDEDRRELQVVVTVEKGSSLVEVNLGEWAEKFSTALVEKMTGSEIVVAVLGTAVVITGAWLIKTHLKNRSEEKRLSLENASRFNLSQEETRRLNIVAEAMKSNSVVRESNVYAEGMRDSLLKSAFDADEFSIQGDLTITGDEAKRTYRSKRREPMPVQLNGNYFINSFKWSDDYQYARVTVQRESDRTEFVAGISVSALTEDQKERFKTATFEHVRVYLQINATVLNNEITTASIISVDEQPAIK